MHSAEVAVTIDSSLLIQLDQLVAQRVFADRSQAIQAALREKLARIDRNRLFEECAKLNPLDEQRLAEEGIGSELESWPAYEGAKSGGRI